MAEEVLIVASKVRNYLKSKGVKMSGELVEGLNKRVLELLDQGSSRTKANKRSTMKSHDV
jgi:hypothetical protein